MLKRLLLIIFALMVAFLGAAFSVRNAHSVNFDYYLGNITTPLSIIMVVSLAIGVSLGILSTLSLIIRLKFKASSCERKFKRLEHNYHETTKSMREKDQEIKGLQSGLQQQNSLPNPDN